MKKWILIGIAAVALIIIIALTVAVSNLGPIIKSAVNKYGPDITKTALSIEDVSISILSGQAKLQGFLLGNPKGFKSATAMKVKAISVDVDKNTITKDVIIINKVEIVGPDVTYEKLKGTDNFKAIMANVQKSVGDSAAKEKSDKKAEKKIIIKDFIIRDGKVTLIQEPFGDKGISAKLPDIHLKNVGGEKDGASPAKVADAVIKELYSKITSSAVTDALNSQLKSITGGVSEGVSKGASGIKGIFGK